MSASVGPLSGRSKPEESVCQTLTFIGRAKRRWLAACPRAS
jgi:hypothetical protein